MPKLKKFKPPAQQAREEELRKRYGGMLCVAEVARELGVVRKTAEKWLSGLTAVNVNGRPRYKVADIVEREMECSEVAP